MKILKEIKLLSKKVEILDSNRTGSVFSFPVLTIFLHPDNNLNFSNPLIFSRKIKINSYRLEQFEREIPGVIFLDKNIRIVENGDSKILEFYNLK